MLTAQRITIGLITLLLLGLSARSAEVFYMDHDLFTDKFVGPVGPLVLSGELVAGDYDQLLSKIAEDEKRFLLQNKMILAVQEGDGAEAIKIAALVKSLYSAVSVGPLTGRCVGVCFLIYTAANQRGVDGDHLLGIHWPPDDDAQMDRVRLALRDNGVPASLIDEMTKRRAGDIYWLTDADVNSVGSKSASFEQLLTAKCGWDASIERDVYTGRRSFEELKRVWACRARITQPLAHKALTAALKERNKAKAAAR